MTEQSGPRDPAERRASDRPGKGVDVFGDLQRWFIRQTAKNMRREIGGQVRRTLGGGRETSDVWDTATTEIPPEVGESPECQWCPICRAARRMRDSGPGIGGQISGAGDVVASAVQDAISALDSLLGKASGPGPVRDSTVRDSTAGDSTAGDSTAEDGPAGDDGRTDSAPWQGGPPGTSDASAGAATAAETGADSARAETAADSAGAETAADSAGAETAADSGGAATVADSAAASWPPSTRPHSAAESDRQAGTSNQAGRDRTAPESRRDRHGLVGLPGGGESDAAGSAAGGAANAGGFSLAGERADRLAAAEDSNADPWGAATASAEADQDSGAHAQPDGPGHEPDDRG